MADEKEKNKEQTGQENKEVKNTGKGGLLKWIVLAAVVIVCAAAGFGLGRILAKPKAPEQTETEQAKEKEKSKEREEVEGTWFHEMTPVVSNLNVPGVTRFVRATLILEISNTVSNEKGIELITQKTPLLNNWLNIFLASLTLEDTRGNKNLTRIQTQIKDAFNEILFPDSKPYIEQVLFKEFAIQ